jgi:hypothetical protein
MYADSENPFAPPAIPADDEPSAPPLTLEQARNKLRIPAYGLGAAALACVIALLVAVPITLVDRSSEPPFTGFGNVISRIIVAALQALLFGGLAWSFARGCIAMWQLRSYSAARWSAVIGIATLGAVCGIALPFSIWALVLLCDDRIRGAFRPGPIRWGFATPPEK